MKNESVFPDLKSAQTETEGETPALHSVWFEGGISKREIFAAMAMQGLLAGGVNIHECEETARASVRNADALILELQKTQSK